MGEFNSDDHYINYCGQESLRRNGVALIVNKSLKFSSVQFSCSGEGNGNPLQCSCLENPMERGVWQATVYGEREGDQMNEKLPRGPQLSLAEKI